jgi:hypothetical protein
MKPLFHKILILDKEKSPCPMLYKGQKLKNQQSASAVPPKLVFKKYPLSSVPTHAFP